MLGFTCYRTGYLNLYLMRTKDQSPKMLQKYLEWITNQNRQVRYLRCDSDPVFKGDDFKLVSDYFAVDVSYSTPYTPTQNTIAECRWGMVAPAARAMLHTTQLPATYWEFAMLTACHLNNRSYHTGVEGVPVALTTGHTPNL